MILACMATLAFEYIINVAHEINTHIVPCGAGERAPIYKITIYKSPTTKYCSILKRLQPFNSE